MKAIEKRLDSLFSRTVKKRANYVCEHCNSAEATDCSHIISRRFKMLRWDLANATAACRECHMRLEKEGEEKRIMEGRNIRIESLDITLKYKDHKRTREDLEELERHLKYAYEVECAFAHWH